MPMPELIITADYDKVGYFGMEEVSKTTWDFCDELTRMYKRIRK